jgi:hypothetical protein
MLNRDGKIEEPNYSIHSDNYDIAEVEKLLNDDVTDGIIFFIIYFY